MSGGASGGNGPTGEVQIAGNYGGGLFGPAPTAPRTDGQLTPYGRALYQQSYGTPYPQPLMQQQPQGYGGMQAHEARLPTNGYGQSSGQFSGLGRFGGMPQWQPSQYRPTLFQPQQLGASPSWMPQPGGATQGGTPGFYGGSGGASDGSSQGSPSNNQGPTPGVPGSALGMGLSALGLGPVGMAIGQAMGGIGATGGVGQGGSAAAQGASNPGGADGTGSVGSGANVGGNANGPADAEGGNAGGAGAGGAGGK